MTAAEPTILATSGGLRSGERTYWEFAPLTTYAVDLAGVTGRAPRVCFISTAVGDNPMVMHNLSEAGRLAGFEVSHLQLFGMPNVPSIEEHLLAQDVIWVMGGSVANLLAVWRVHGVDRALRAAWEAGVVLTGVSAGSICWHVGGTTDSFGPHLAPVTDGLALLPFGNGVHYDTEERRRPLLQSLVADGTLPDSYCTDDGVGIVYRGTAFAEAVAENPSGGAYFVTRSGDGAREDAIDVRRL
ncbi:peptidase E [Branchiibius sp. NY16-3462-2]|uniref:Type 1 glutamine amidotransferase-like domain-containing protein n=1 Tax=Branchiibius sp. NY16-3462-2 TaxID=1807500 RepID=UPI000799350B|nr:peptidase E [Branchiibius sp. NY16-3462-2]KYH46009.1 peptidase E [Branchiibius sp. NY16-3462-2]